VPALEQPGSQTLDNPRHEKFARYVAQGLSDSESYRKAFDCSIECAYSNAWLIRENEGVQARIKYLLTQSAQKLVLTLAEKRAFLRDAVLTSVGTVDESSPLAQSVETEELQSKDDIKIVRKKVKIVDKLKALELDAKLAGELDGPERGVSIRLMLESVHRELPKQLEGETIIDIESEVMEGDREIE
jgi:hypothetical protein